MTDPIDIATNIGSAAGGGGLIAGIMQFFRTREAREARDALISLQGKVDRLVADVEKLSAIDHEVTTAANSVSALHRRTDQQDARLDDHETRLRAIEAGGATPATTPPQRPRRK